MTRLALAIIILAGCTSHTESDAGPCDVGMVTVSASGLIYEQRIDVACPVASIEPGPDGVMCFDPSNTGIDWCCAGLSVSPDDAAYVCASH